MPWVGPGDKPCYSMPQRGPITQFSQLGCHLPVRLPSRASAMQYCCIFGEVVSRHTRQWLEVWDLAVEPSDALAGLCMEQAKIAQTCE